MAFAPFVAMARTYIVSDDLYVFLNKDAPGRRFGIRETDKQTGVPVLAVGQLT